MKTVMILCLVTLAGTTSWSLNERASSVPTGVQRQRPRRVLLLPKTNRRDMQRLFYLKHLLELNCLRHICNGGQCKGSKCPAALKSIERNQYDQVHHSRNNQYRGPAPYRKEYESDNRMVVIPPNIYFINPRVENSQMPQKTPKGGKLVKQNTDNVIYIQFPPQNEEARAADDQSVEEKSNNADGDDMQMSNSESLAKSRATTSHPHWQEPHRNQYEVKEVIDEDPTHTEGDPFFVIQKATDEAYKEEFGSRSGALENDRNNDSVKEGARSFLNHKSRELVNEKPQQTRQEDAKHLRITPPIVKHLTKAQTTEQPTNSGTTPTVSTEKKMPDMPDLLSDLFDSLEFFTDEPETDKSTPETRKPSSTSVSEIQTAAKVVSKGLRELITAANTDSDTKWTFPEDSKTSPSVVNMVKTVEYFSEETINKADLTTPNFQEFSDHPLVFDLLPKPKPKDPETAWKNSRKMHFGDTPKTTTANRDEQRRSDILINENDDYNDYENTLSTSNYLKENSSLLSFDLPKNPSPDEVIPLIPLVISDLRDYKIPDESLPVLSELFGKYWPNVLALSNSTNLDMLPLMKMKNEKDLESVMESVLPENSEQATTTTTTTKTTTEKTEAEPNKNLYYDLYDYDADRDLYKEFGGGQEVGLTDKRRKRFESDLAV